MHRLVKNRYLRDNIKRILARKPNKFVIIKSWYKTAPFRAFLIYLDQMRFT